MVVLKGRSRREVDGRVVLSLRCQGVTGRRVSVVLGHSDAPPSGDLGKSELDVLGGDGFSAS